MQTPFHLFDPSRLGVLGIFLIVLLTGCTETHCPGCDDNPPTAEKPLLSDDRIPTLKVGECALVEVLDDDRLPGGARGQNLEIVSVSNVRNGTAEIVGQRPNQAVEYCATQVGQSRFDYTARDSRSRTAPTATATATGTNVPDGDGEPGECENNRAPSLDLSAVADANNSMTVILEATGTDPDGEEDLDIEFDYGDGSTRTEEGQHTYSNPGTYTITGYLTDPCGETDTNTVQFTAKRANARPVIELQFTPPLDLPYSGSTPLATCSDREDGNLTVRYYRANGNQISQSDILQLTEQQDITAKCGPDSDGLFANELTFAVVPAAYDGVVANEDRIPQLPVGQSAIIENLDDDQYSPTDDSNDQLEIYRVDMVQNGNVDIGNMVIVNGVFEFQVATNGRVTQFRKTQSGRGSFRYHVRRTNDTSETAFAFTREDVSSGRRASDGQWYRHTDGRNYRIKFVSTNRYEILEVR